MSMTYAPKIDAVRDGTCAQTIRRGDRFCVGDEALFHGGMGKPYWTPWSWCMCIRITEVYNITVGGYGFHDHKDVFRSWDSGYADYLAERDGIMPSTGVALRDVLREIYGDEFDGDYQVIRWEVMN